MSVAVAEQSNEIRMYGELDYLADLIAAGRIAHAREIAGEILQRVTPVQRAVITYCVRALEAHPYGQACQQLESFAQSNPDHAGLVAQCTPATDPHTYRPDASTTRTPAHPPTNNPTRRTTPRRATARDANRIRGDAQAGAYLAEQGPEPTENRTPDEPPAGYQHDFDVLAAYGMRGFPCVCCFCERSRLDKQHTDGLCGECRSRKRPGFFTMAHGRPIPASTPEEKIAAWCITVAIRYPEAARRILRRRWHLVNPSARTIITDIAKTYLPAQDAAAPQPTPEPAPVVMLDTRTPEACEDPRGPGGMSSDADILARNDGFIDEIRDGTLIVEVVDYAPQSQPAAAA